MALVLPLGPIWCGRSVGESGVSKRPLRSTHYDWFRTPKPDRVPPQGGSRKRFPPCLPLRPAPSNGFSGHGTAHHTVGARIQTPGRRSFGVKPGRNGREPKQRTYSGWKNPRRGGTTDDGCGQMRVDMRLTGRRCGASQWPRYLLEIWSMRENDLTSRTLLLQRAQTNALNGCPGL